MIDKNEILKMIDVGDLIINTSREKISDAWMILKISRLDLDSHFIFVTALCSIKTDIRNFSFYTKHVKKIDHKVFEYNCQGEWKYLSDF